MDLYIPGVNDKLPDDFHDAKHERQPHGTLFMNGREVATTLMCPHCGGHFISRAGSGHRRTFCMKCMGVTCGLPACDPCRPWQKMLALDMSAGREF